MSRKANIIGIDSPVSGGAQTNMGFRHMTSMDVGRIQTIVMQECVPNDKINLDMKAFVTTAPNVAPLAGKFIMNLAAFYCPNRVVWEKWNEFIAGFGNYSIPSFNGLDLESALSSTVAQNNDVIAHFSGMGIDPTRSYHYYNGSTKVGMKMSLLPLRVYRRLWWDWFRNPSVIPDTNESTYINRGTTSEGISTYIAPHYANWAKDFLTNNLRTPHGDSRSMGSVSGTSAVNALDNRGAATAVSSSASALAPSVSSDAITPSGRNTNLSPAVNTFATVNVEGIRVGIALENWILKCQVLGGRLIDRLRGMFGTSPSPLTLQMSEYLGRSSFALDMQVEAANDSTTNGSSESETNFNAFGTTDPASANMKGQLSGKSTSTENGLSNVNYHVKEHGYFVVLGWIMPDAMVTDGIASHWTRGIDGPNASRFQFYDASFDGVNFDPLLLRDCTLPYKTQTDTQAAYGSYSPYTVIGYRGNYESYRYNKDVKGGCFVDPNTRVSMSSWVLDRDLQREYGLAKDDFTSETAVSETSSLINFDTLPTFGRTNRHLFNSKFVVASSDFDHFVVDFKIGLDMVRPMSAITAPRIDSFSKVAAEVGGSRL